MIGQNGSNLEGAIADTNGHRPAALVIGVGGESRRKRFREAGFTVLMYKYLRQQYTLDNQPWEDSSSPITTSDYTYFDLDKRLYEHGLEGRRVVVLAPPYTGPRKG